MQISIQKEIQNIVIEYLKDGQERTVEDIRKALYENGLEEDQVNGSLRMALYLLKKENADIRNPRRGVYYMNMHYEEKRKSSKYDFAGYKSITESTKKEPALVVSIMEDGSFRLNSKLLDLFPDKKAKVFMKPNGEELVLIDAGEEDGLVRFGSSGSTRNYILVNMLKKLKKSFPVYYVGEWDEEERVWIGKYSSENPNRTNKEKKMLSGEK